MRQSIFSLKMSMTWGLGLLVLSSCIARSATNEPISYRQLAELTDTAQIIGEETGISVAMSGDTAVVGANNESTENGAAYVFVKPSSGWANMTQTATLTASDGVAGDGFGQAVAIGGDVILVAAQNSSAVYLYVNPAGGWQDMTQTAKLTASAGQSRFGLALGVSGNTVVIGSYGTNQEGTAYVYEKPSGGWVDMQQTGELLASDKGDFGLAVAISGNTIVVGSPTAISQEGVANLYTKPVGGWKDVEPVGTLTSNPVFAGANFGQAVSIAGDTVVVGAFLAGNLRTGMAYIFVEPHNGWGDMTQTAQLFAPAGVQFFGSSVSIGGTTIVVGSPYSVQTGIACVYVKPANGWVTTSRANALLKASDGANEDLFGASVSVSNGMVLVGAFQHNELRGAAYVFGP